MPDQKGACHMVHSRLSSSASGISFIYAWWTGLRLTCSKLGRIEEEKHRSCGGFFECGQEPASARIGNELSTDAKTNCCIPTFLHLRDPFSNNRSNRYTIFSSSNPGVDVVIQTWLEISVHVRNKNIDTSAKLVRTIGCPHWLIEDYR